MWDESSGKMLHEIQPLTAPELLKPNRFTRLVCLAFRSDDELFVAGEGVLTQVNLKTGTSTLVAGLDMGPPPTSERERFAVGSNTVMTLAFSSDQRLAALGLAKGDIVIRDVTKNWEIITTLRGHTRGVTSLAFSSDGRRLASCSGRYFIWHFLELDNRPGEVMLWDTATWQSPLTLLRRQDSEFLGVGFANDNRTLFAVANRLDPRASQLPVGELIRWDTRERVPEQQATDKPAAPPPKHAEFLSVGFGLNGYHMCGCTSIAIHPNGQLVAGFTVKGQLMLWDASTGETVSTLQTDEDLGYPFGQMQFSENGSQLLYYKANRLGKNMVGEYTVPQLQLARNREAKPDELFLFPLRYLPPSALSADRSRRVKAIQKEQKLEVVSVTDQQVLFSAPFEDRVTDCGFSRDGKICFVLSVRNEDAEKPAGKPLRIQRWSVPDGQPLPAIEGLAYPAKVSPDMDYAVSMLEADKYFAVELATGQRSAEPVALELDLRGLLFFPDGQRFATYGNSTGIHLWNLSTPAKRP